MQLLKDDLDAQGLSNGQVAQKILALDEVELTKLGQKIDLSSNELLELASLITGAEQRINTDIAQRVAALNEQLVGQGVASESFKDNLQYLKALSERLPNDSDLQSPLRALVEEIEQVEAKLKPSANELIEQIEQAKQDLVTTFDEPQKSSSKSAQRESGQITDNKVVNGGVDEKKIDVAASQSEEGFEGSVNLVADSRTIALDSEQKKAASIIVAQKDKAKESNEKTAINENDKVSSLDNKREHQSAISEGYRANTEASNTYQARLESAKQQSVSTTVTTPLNELAVDEEYSDNLTEQENNSAPYGADVEQKNKVQGSFEHLLKQLETTMQKTVAINNANEESASVNQINTDTEQLDKLREQPVATSKQIAEQLAQKLPLNEQAAAKHLKERVSLLINAGQGQAVIQLDPEELGGLSIRIQMQNDQVNVQFLVQNAGAKELLEQAMPKLKELLDEQGIALNQSDVQQEEQQQNSQDNPSSFAGDNDEFETDQTPITLTLHKQSTNGIDYYA